MGFLLALLAAALSFRAPIVGVATVTDGLRDELQIEGARIGLLTGLPVLTFGLAAPLAMAVIRRVGPDVAMLACLSGVTLGTVIRSSGGFSTAVAGTAVIGVSITIGNVVVPPLIRDRVPASSTSVVTGLYTAAMNVGSMAVTLLTPALADLAGWRLGLSAWAAVSGIAIIVWLAAVRPRLHAVGARPVAHGTSTRQTSRRSTGYLLALAFAGQAGAYYGLTSWLPSLLHDRAHLGEEAAVQAASVFQILALLGALSVPLMAARLPRWAMVLIAGVAWMSCPVVLLLAPQLFLMACILGGFAQGAGFTVILVIMVTVSRTTDETAAMSAVVQGLGYCVATLMPIVMGLALDHTGTWTVPLLLAAAATGTFTLGCLLALTSQRDEDGG